MNKLIPVTLINGIRVMINVNHIQSIESTEDNTVLILLSNKPASYEANETFENLFNKLNNVHLIVK